MLPINICASKLFSEIKKSVNNLVVFALPIGGLLLSFLIPK